jgi:hypothetical protein
MPLALAMLSLFRFRFEDMQRRVAGVGDQGAGRRVFRFGRERLAAVTDADRFFFQFGGQAATCPRACEQKCASKDNARRGLP